MATLTVAHTAQLEPSTLDDAWRMVRAAFPPGEFGDEDWSHALGGMHAVVEEGGRVVAQGSVVLRRFIHDGRTLRVGYVEAVAVAADVRRRGQASEVMDALESIIRGGHETPGDEYALNALSPHRRGRSARIRRGNAADLSGVLVAEGDHAETRHGRDRVRRPASGRPG